MCFLPPPPSPPPPSPYFSLLISNSVAHKESFKNDLMYSFFLSCENVSYLLKFILGR